MITTNHKKLSKKLKDRGWKKEHIDTTLAIMKKAKKHSQHDKLFYIAAIAFILVGNCFLLIGLLPFLLELPPWFVICILALTGLSFGFAVDKILSEHEFTRLHYFLVMMILPAASVILIQIIVIFANRLMGNFISIVDKYTLAMCFSYVLCFSLPHIIRKSVR